MQRVGAGLVAIQAATSMRPPDPDAGTPPPAHAGLGTQSAAKDLLAKLDSMQAQVSLLTASLKEAHERSWRMDSVGLTPEHLVLLGQACWASTMLSPHAAVSNAGNDDQL